MHGTVHLFDNLPHIARVDAHEDKRVSAPVRAVPLVGVIRNRRSHRNGGAMPEWNGRATFIVEVPQKRSELGKILTGFAERRIDYLVVDGGDGTVRDVLTCGAGVFGESWPPVILLANGKTNALATDLGLPIGWQIADALTAAEEGHCVKRRPMVIAQRDDEGAMVQGFVFGAGAFTAATSLGQTAHRSGAFNSMAVGVTAAWSVFQGMFGGAANAWRRGTKMRLLDADGKEVPHSGIGPIEERYLVFASTLQTFPAGLNPFRGIEKTLRIGVLDNSRRSLLFRLPLMMFGRISQRTRQLGCHTLGVDEAEIDIAANFILDGEAFPPGRYRLSLGPTIRFIVP